MRRQHHVRGRITWHLAPAPLCLLALGFLTLAGCYLPPFDEKLAESEQFAAGLTHVGRLGPVYIDEWMYAGGYFLPSREFDASASPDGFWVRQNETDLIAAYLKGSEIKSSNHTAGNALEEGFVAFPLTAEEVSDFGTSLPPRGLLVIFGSDAQTSMPALATDSGLGLNIPFFPFFVSPTPSGSIVGASYCIESQSLDRAAFLYQSQDSSPVFSGGSLSAPSSTPWAASSLLLSVNSDSSGTLPALEAGAFFGYCAYDDRYFVSGYRKDNSGLCSAYWQGNLASTPETLPRIAARISAILSTHRLLAVGDGIMYLYDLDGTSVTSFTTGNMHFAYEYYDSSDGVWYCYFTRAVRTKDNNSGKVTVDVYRCRTADLDFLGN